MYAKMIMGLANGIIGTQILTACKNAQPSVIAYMAGSIAYIGNDVYEALERAFKHQEESQDMAGALPEPGPDATAADIEAYQKQMSDQQLKSQKKMKADAERDLKTFKRKEIIAWAIASVYGIAMALSIIEAWLSLPPYAGINKDGSANCSGDMASGTEAITKGVLMAYKLSSILQTVSSATTTIKGMADNKKVDVMSLAGLGFSAPAAYKNFESLLGKGTKAAEKAKGLLDNQWVRIGVFVGFAALAGVIAKGVSDERKNAQKRVDDLSKVIAEMEGTKPTTEIAPGPAAAAPGVDPVKELPQGNIKTLANIKKPKNCFSQGAAGVEMSEASCARPIKFKKLEFGQFKLNSSTLTQGANLATDLGNAIASGDMAKFDETATGLAAMAGKIKEMNDELLGKVNEARGSVKEKPIDFKKEAAAIMSSMEKDFNGGSSLGGADLASTSAPTEEEKKADDTKVVTASAPAPVVPDTLPEVTLDSESALEDTSSLADSSKGEQSLADFETTEQDINKKSDVSIFKQLSNRYILNYTKIFDRKRAPEVTEGPAKN